ELYLRIVLDEASLVNSDALHRFLERDETRRERERAKSGDDLQSSTTAVRSNSSAFKNMGEGVLGALTKAPYTATEGSKAIFGNVLRKMTIPQSAGGENDGVFIGSGSSPTKTKNRTSNILGFGGNSIIRTITAKGA